MDVEKLKELKWHVRGEWMSKPTVLTEQDCKDIEELIDEAIANQLVAKSATSEEVQRAIEELSKSAWRIVRPDTDYRADIPRLLDDNIRKLAIIALQRMKTRSVYNAVGFLEIPKGTFYCSPQDSSALESALAQMQGWISVKDRLPEPIISTSGFDVKNTYLVASFEDCNPSAYFYGYNLAHYWESGWGGVDGSRGLSVTHWMPLPQKPEENNDG